MKEMKLICLSGAYKNAGDFLIEMRTKRLLEHVLKNISITTILRKDIVERFAEIEKADAVIYSGGPIYLQDLNTYMPLKYCKQLVEKTMILGGGWWGDNAGSESNYEYQFTEESKMFFAAVGKYGYGCSCRDLYTVRALQKEQVQNVFMVGCPAWYDLKYIHEKVLASGKIIKNILISDPAMDCNFSLSLMLIDYLKKRYPDATISYVFHRGTTTDEYTPYEMAASIQNFIEELEKRSIKYTDISYCADGFQIYDTCDLHVGFRVHAHIYNLSHRNRTVLIEEDGRGAGVNQALGLPHIKAYNDEISSMIPELRAWRRNSGKIKNSHFLEEVALYLDILECTHDQYLLNAFSLMEKYYFQMVKFIKRLEKRGGSNGIILC